MSETVIRARIDSGLKLEAQALLERFGLTMSEAHPHFPESGGY